ncbi:hypothetical protein [uncultured Methanobrevibacter sp.]|uniref:tautomerase family protein n=1 Tax=uncultured Methanobrevibacter sp. TaxID=253161 RepID=UPI0025D9C513|nr:hypothetical protein [uncultured Methanobrevibacter sp.]
MKNLNVRLLKKVKRVEEINTELKVKEEKYLLSSINRNVKKEFEKKHHPQVICENTSTLSKNIYVIIQEINQENARKSAPNILINWSMMPDRTDDAKKKIMKDITRKLRKIQPEFKDEIVIVINNLPLRSVMLGGETRLENPDK